MLSVGYLRQIPVSSIRRLGRENAPMNRLAAYLIAVGILWASAHGFVWAVDAITRYGAAQP